jgi:hypothetical protein
MTDELGLFLIMRSRRLHPPKRPVLRPPRFEPSIGGQALSPIRLRRPFVRRRPGVRRYPSLLAKAWFILLAHAVPRCKDQERCRQRVSSRIRRSG